VKRIEKKNLNEFWWITAQKACLIPPTKIRGDTSARDDAIFRGFFEIKERESMSKKAVLLINLGSPDHCDNKSVRAYLREFLNDPRVIDLPGIWRWLLVNVFIIPLRYKKTAQAYQKIWGGSGSPLISISKKVKAALSAELGPGYQVEIGMRYGHPSIPQAFEKMKDCDEIIVLPLFPQYSSAATGSAIEQLLLCASKQWNIPQVIVKRDFYNDEGFVHAFAEIIKQRLSDKKIDKLIFSYHGLPQRHIVKSQCNATCDLVHACPAVMDENRFCYRAQCYETSRSIAQVLGLTPDQYMVSFQSRLGRTPWIKPYTDLMLPELAQQGIKNIAMVSPSFVADCLETLEEINLRLREQWKSLGGNQFIFIPCVNDHSLWIKGLVNMVLSA
jgi:ferrochelatase